MRKILGFTLIIVLFVLVLRFGGFSLNDFSNQIHLRDPGTVLSPLTDNIPKGHEVVGDIPTGNGGGYTFDPNARLDGGTGNNENTSYSPIINGTTSNEENNSELPNESVDTSVDATESSTVENESKSKEESKEESKAESKEESKTEVESKAEPKEESKNDSKDKKEDTTQEANINTKTWTFTIGDKTLELTPENTASFLKWLETQFKNNSTITYTDNSDSSNTSSSPTYASNEEISNLISSINIVDALPTTADYNRTNFEKPVKSYTLDGKKVNRNDYAWKTSPYFNEADFTYTCPYTGKVITDMDDNKEDNDYGNIDYDHIVPLKSAYLRGASEWTDEQRNAYAYDQSVGVDVLNSANRSKSDKGPAEWLPDINRGSYCYSWLVICQKYNLSMTQEEIDICNAEIEKAIKNGEPVVFMGGHN